MILTKSSIISVVLITGYHCLIYDKYINKQFVWYVMQFCYISNFWYA